jgi:hypothetical protein
MKKDAVDESMRLLQDAARIHYARYLGLLVVYMEEEILPKSAKEYDEKPRL